MPDVLTLDASPELSDGVIRQCLASFRHVRLRTTGGCMEPMLSAGETVLVAGTALRRPRIGDMVLVRQSAGLRLHRLIWGPPFALPSSGWRTMSDRAQTWDARVSPRDVLGTVVGVEGTPRRAVRSRPGVAVRSLCRGLGTRLRLVLRRRVP